MASAARLLPRNISDLLREALQDARVVFVNGARQAGKTTLVRKLAEELGASYQTLDERAARDLARDDPDEFVHRNRPMVIDEVQRGGDDLLLAIKAEVDRDPRPGRFLLTGSTRFLTVPDLSESLAGRVELIDLWPLSQGEIEGVRDGFIDRLFASTQTLRRLRPVPVSREAAFERVCRGGFPAAVARDPRQRARWLGSYLRTLTERDVGEVANIQRVADLPALVRLLAGRTAAELNMTALANDADVPRTTLIGYLPLLESVFLLFRIPAWSRNVTSKQVKQARMHFTDSALAAHLLGASPASLARAGARMAGPLLETFVASELARQATWSQEDVTLHYFRNHAGAEVDLVLESRDGRVAAVEVKAGRSVGRNDVRSLTLLRDRVGEDFVNGVVLACAESTQPLGERLTSMPLSALWA
jgi:predicted AAA+ superfamily ATPase